MIPLSFLAASCAGGSVTAAAPASPTQNPTAASVPSPASTELQLSGHPGAAMCAQRPAVQEQLQQVLGQENASDPASVTAERYRVASDLLQAIATGPLGREEAGPVAAAFQEWSDALRAGNSADVSVIMAATDHLAEACRAAP